MIVQQQLNRIHQSNNSRHSTTSAVGLHTLTRIQSSLYGTACRPLHQSSTSYYTIIVSTAVHILPVAAPLFALIHYNTIFHIVYMSVVLVRAVAIV